METFSSQIQKLIEELAALPGIGAKSAQRLAFYIINTCVPSWFDLLAIEHAADDRADGDGKESRRPREAHDEKVMALHG